MAVRVTDLRCPNPECSPHGATLLAEVIEVSAGWVERKCHHCDQVYRITATESTAPTVKLRCDGQRFTHTIGEASADWRGTAVIFCRKCGSSTTITSPPEPQAARAETQDPKIAA